MSAPIRLSDLSWVLPLRTPTLPPAETTNTWIVGGRTFAVVEPATPHRDCQAELFAHIQGRLDAGDELSFAAITHHHSDHIGGVVALRERFGVPLVAHAATAARVPFAVDRALDDGDLLPLGNSLGLRALHTPGHAPGHLIYVLEDGRSGTSAASSGQAHLGDLVAGEGTILIDPQDDGDMGAYLESLDRLAGADLALGIPAHGPVQEDVAGLCRHYIAHRTAREARVLEAVPEDGAADLASLAAAAYADTPAAHPALAQQSTLAHLNHLVDQGRVEAVSATRFRRRR